jgi:hypothetical protein
MPQTLAEEVDAETEYFYILETSAEDTGPDEAMTSSVDSPSSASQAMRDKRTVADTKNRYRSLVDVTPSFGSGRIDGTA